MLLERENDTLNERYTSVANPNDRMRLSWRTIPNSQRHSAALRVQRDGRQSFSETPGSPSPTAQSSTRHASYARSRHVLVCSRPLRLALYRAVHHSGCVSPPLRFAKRPLQANIYKAMDSLRLPRFCTAALDFAHRATTSCGFLWFLFFIAVHQHGRTRPLAPNTGACMIPNPTQGQNSIFSSQRERRELVT